MRFKISPGIPGKDWIHDISFSFQWGQALLIITNTRLVPNNIQGKNAGALFSVHKNNQFHSSCGFSWSVSWENMLTRDDYSKPWSRLWVSEPASSCLAPFQLLPDIQIFKLMGIKNDIWKHCFLIDNIISFTLYLSMIGVVFYSSHKLNVHWRKQRKQRE